MPADEVALVERLRMAVNVRARLLRDTMTTAATRTKTLHFARACQAENEAVMALIEALTEDA